MNGSSMRKNGASSIGKKEFFMLFLCRACFCDIYGSTGNDK